MPHVNLNLSYGIPYQSLSQGQVTNVNTDVLPKNHHMHKEKTPVWLNKQGVHKKMDEQVLRELL